LLNGFLAVFKAKKSKKSQIFNSLIIKQLKNCQFLAKTFSTENLFVFN